MASITPPFRYTEGGAHPTAHGDNTATDNINDWLEGSAITNLDQTNFNPDNVDGNAAVASLRTLGTGSVNACAGNDARLSDARAANAIINDASYPIATSAPSTGDVLTFDGTNWGPAPATAGAAIDGTGTVDCNGTAPGPADNVLTGTSTNFLSELHPGDLVIVNTGDSRRIVSVTSNTNATVDQNWATTVTGQTFQYILGSRVRPFDRTVAKSADYSISSADAGTTFICDCSGGNVVGTLPSAALFRDGDTITIVKDSDDINSAQLTPDGTDTIDGVNSSYAIYTINGMVTIQRTGSGSWRIVSERYKTTTVLQSVSNTDTTEATNTTNLSSAPGGYIPFDNTIPQIDEGAEIINVSITPIASNSVLRIRAQLQIATANGDGNTDFIAALFHDVAANTDASVTVLHGMDTGFNKNQVIVIETEIPSPGATAATISIRGSRTSNGDWYVNKSKDNASVFGLTMTTSIEVREIAA